METAKRPKAKAYNVRLVDSKGIVWWSRQAEARPDARTHHRTVQFSKSRFSRLLYLHLSACSACPYLTLGKSVFKPFPEDFFQIFNAHSGRVAVLFTSFLIDIRFSGWQAVAEDFSVLFRGWGDG